MAFWDELSAIQIRKDSGLLPTQIREQNETTMTAFIQSRITANGIAVRRTVDNASGKLTFSETGFAPESLAVLFPAKVESGAYLLEGNDLLALAREAVRFRTLFDLESRNKGSGSEAFSGGATGQARTYEQQAIRLEQSIIEAIQDALTGPERGAPEGESGRKLRRTSSTTRIVATY